MSEKEYAKLLLMIKDTQRHIKREDVYRANKSVENLKIEIKKIFFKKNKN